MTFMAIIGMMGLIGMMVKNAIVLVDEISRPTKPWRSSTSASSASGSIQSMTRSGDP